MSLVLSSVFELGFLVTVSLVLSSICELGFLVTVWPPQASGLDHLWISMCKLTYHNKLIFDSLATNVLKLNELRFED